MKKRINAFSKAIKQKKIDAFILFDPANIRYLTGIDSRGILLFTAKKEMVYFTSPIYKAYFDSFSQLKIIICKNNLLDQIPKELKKLKVKKVGFSENKISFQDYQRINEKISTHKINFIKSNSPLEKLRSIKSSSEIKLIKKAVSVSQQALSYAEEISQNTTEKDLSIEIERFLRLKSDNRTAFPSIVATGKNTVFPHHDPTETLISNFFLIDLGAMHCGYCSDLTRLFFWDKMPPLLRKAYNAIKKAQATAIKRIREGVKASEVDRAAREIIEKEGFGKYFLHGLGHGIGLEVHEKPYLKPNNSQPLKEGMVLTVEPAIYYKNLFGVRIEDMVVVNSRKCEVIS